MSKFNAVLRLFAIALIVFTLAVSPSLVCKAPAPDRATIMAAGDEGSVHVNVTDEAGRPIEGANITIMSNVTFYNHTGADGGYLIQNVGVGTHTINALMPGYLNGSAPANVIKNKVTNVTVVVEGGEFSGLVYTQDNVPLGNATVEVAVGTAILQNLTDPDGGFNITGIPTGSYIVVVFSQSHTAVTDIVTVNAGATTVRSQPFKLSRNTGWITGYVFDAGVPVQSAIVSISIGAIEHRGLSSVVGYYEMPEVPAGNYTVHASKDGYVDTEIVNVMVVNGVGTDNVNITLTGMSATVSGSVTMLTSEGAILLYGALIEVLGTGQNATTGTGGLYEITDVPVGTWTIRTSAPGYETNDSYSIVVNKGAKLTFNVELTPKPGQLSGTVRSDDAFELLEGYRVTISGTMQRETYTNDQGQYVFAGLTPGNYTITVVPPSSDSRFSPYIAYNTEVEPEGVTTHDVNMKLVKQTLGGFVFGLDLSHSFMVLALVLTLMVLVIAVYVRLRRFQTPVKREEPEGGEEKEMPPVQ